MSVRRLWTHFWQGIVATIGAYAWLDVAVLLGPPVGFLALPVALALALVVINHGRALGHEGRLHTKHSMQPAYARHSARQGRRKCRD